MESCAIHEEHDPSVVRCKKLLSQAQARHIRGDFEGEVVVLTKVIKLLNISAKMKVRALYLRGFAFEAMGDVKSALEDTTLAKKILAQCNDRKCVGAHGMRVIHKKRLQKFDDFIKRLRSWVKSRGYLPWVRGHSLEERQLAQWVTSMRTCRGNLPEDARKKLESVQGWAWEARSSVEPLPSSESAEESDPSPQRRTRRQDVGDVKEVKAKLLRVAQEKLSVELARNPDPVGRRLVLRRWQLMYHPDKNPEKVDEVLAIFRWVMSLWNKDHRTSGPVDSASSKTSTDQARAKNSK